MNNFVQISGCSGGGKSALIAELRARGYTTVDEPGRRIVEEELFRDGSALPWVNMAAFAERALAMALSDWRAALNAPGVVFFDRGLVDALTAVAHASGRTGSEIADKYRYNQVVFLTPPWPELFENDQFRRHNFDDAVAEYDRLTQNFDTLGYQANVLPKVGVVERADLILSELSPLFACG